MIAIAPAVMHRATGGALSVDTISRVFRQFDDRTVSARRARGTGNTAVEKNGVAT